MKFFLDRTSLQNLVAQLEAGLRALELKDNFAGFAWSGSIDPTATEIIKNGFKAHIPSGFIITDAQGCNSIVRGTRWDQDYVSLTNLDSSLTATVTVFFIR